MLVTTRLFVLLPRTRSKPKKVYLSMNVYCGLPFHTRAAVKRQLSSDIQCQLAVLKPIIGPCSLTATLYTPNRQRRDLANFCSVIEKIVDDAVVTAGLLPDDDVLHLNKVTYVFGGICKLMPRCELNYKENPC